MKEQNLDLSVILACYNEEDILIDSFKIIKEVLDKTLFKYEIIFVDDYSKDSTVELISVIMKENDNVRLIRHSRNMGRGKAVEDGIKASQGKIAGFLDIDLQVPAHYIIPLVIEIENGVDIATAHRIYKIRLHMINRYILSRGYNILLNILLKTGMKDTETGFKFFKREKILSILEEIKDKHWFWDTEVMVRSYLKGYLIKEVPCLCIRREVEKSTVKIFKDTIHYFISLWRFKKEIDPIRLKKQQKNDRAR